MFQLCINRDNLLVPLILAANQISVHQMRKCYKLSILVQFLSVKVLASKQLFIHPCLIIKLSLFPSPPPSFLTFPALPPTYLTSFHFRFSPALFSS